MLCANHPSGSSLALGRNNTMPPLDESKSAAYIGKTILVGVTYLDADEKLIEQKQWAGTIHSFSNKEGIKIQIRNSDSFFCLPPDSKGIQKARPGDYTLRSTGEVIENPDYLATWIRISPKEK